MSVHFHGRGAVGIDLRLRPALGTLEQDVRLELEGDGATWVDLRLHPGLVVERCESSAGTADYRQSGEQVRVIFDSPLDGTVEVRLRITGHPRDGSDDRIEPRWVALDPDLDWYPRLDGARTTAGGYSVRKGGCRNSPSSRRPRSQSAPARRHRACACRLLPPRSAARHRDRGRDPTYPGRRSAGQGRGAYRADLRI